MREVRALFWSSSFRLGQSPIWNYLRQRTLISASSIVENFISSWLKKKKPKSHSSFQILDPKKLVCSLQLKTHLHNRVRASFVPRSMAESEGLYTIFSPKIQRGIYKLVLIWLTSLNLIEMIQVEKNALSLAWFRIS